MKWLCGHRSLIGASVKRQHHLLEPELELAAFFPLRLQTSILTHTQKKSTINLQPALVSIHNHSPFRNVYYQL